MEPLFAALGRLVHARPASICLAVCGLTLGGILALNKFEIDPDVSSMFPPENESVALLRETSAGMQASRSLHLILRAPSLEESMEDLLSGLRDSPLIDRVDGLASEFIGAQLSGAREAPLWFLEESDLKDLERALSDKGRSDAITESRALLAADPLAGKEVILRDPLGLRWVLGEAARGALPDSLSSDSPYLMSRDKDAAIVRVHGKDDPFNVTYSLALLDDVEERLDGVEVQAIGGYAIAREDSSRIKGDLRSSLGWSIPLILLFLGLSTRSWLLPHIILLPVVIAVLWSLGFGGLLLGPMTPLAVSSAAILIGLGVDYTIHYTGRFREERARSTLVEATERTHRVTGRVLLGGMLTSVAAFLTLSIGSFPGLQSLGLLLALGLLAVLISTWSVLPLLLRFFDRAIPPTPEGFVASLAVRLNSSRYARPAAAALALLALAGWLASSTRGLVFDANPERLRPEDSITSRAAADLQNQLGFAPLALTVLMSQEQPAERLRSGVRQLQESGAIALATGAFQSPPAPDQAERVALFRERTVGWVEDTKRDLAAAGFRPEAFQGGLDDWASLFSSDPAVDAVAEGEVLTWGGTNYWRATLHPSRAPESREERKALYGEIQTAMGVPVKIVEPGALSDELGPLLESELRRSLFACGLVVLLIALLSIGSIRAGLVALTPVACGLGVSLGVLSVLGWPLHPGNLLALPLILGLGVDDGLHMVHRAREGGADPLRTTGTQVWRTTVTTALGFGSLISASSPAIASLGLIVLVGTVICFVASVLLVPQLLGKVTT